MVTSFVIFCLWTMLKTYVYPQRRIVTSVTPDGTQPSCCPRALLRRWGTPQATIPGLPAWLGAAFQALPLPYLMTLGNPSHTKYINVGEFCVVMQTSGCFKCRCCWKLRGLLLPYPSSAPSQVWGTDSPQPKWVTYTHDLHSWLPRALQCEAGKIGISQFSGYCVSFSRQGNISC